VSTFANVDELLADARSRLARLTPQAAAMEISRGARLVDIRPDAQRLADGEVPGAVIIERNHLEWRLDPSSDARVPAAQPGQFWIVICQDGYTSSLAANSLQSIGVPATDVEGGFTAWRAAGLPTVPGGTPPEQVVRPD
jgi:rhodanese-related sulfurtransferase